MNTLVEQQFGHGGIQDTFDSRDYQYKDIAGATTPFDWSVGFDIEKIIGKIPVKNQGSSYSCGGQAWSYYGQVLEAVVTGSFEERSAKYVYAQTHVPGGGSKGRDNADVFCKQGIAQEYLLPSYPNTETNMTAAVDITPAIRDDARDDQALIYAQVGTDIDAIAEAMRDNHGVILGVDGQNNGTWTSAYPRPPISTEWRHWLFACKAKMVDGIKYIGVINSWGTTIGENGVQWLSEDYFTTGHVWSAWTHVLKVSSVSPFNVDLKLGDSSDEVKKLQNFLKILGYFPKEQESTGYYGNITRSSVYEFQKKEMILSPWEFLVLRGSRVGIKTRTALNSLIK